MKKRVIATGVAAAALLLTPIAASASTGADFGSHVSEHVRSHDGFTGDHNPGVIHQGLSGWDHGEHHAAG